MKLWKTCCFTGHRPAHLPWGYKEEESLCVCCKELLAVEIERAYQDGYRRFLSGMAMGTDLICAEAVLACQEIHPDVRLEAVIPCSDQTRGWPFGEVWRYQRILEGIGPEHQILVQQQRTRYCMIRRDQYMVNQSHRIIALYDGYSSGGTQYTLGYALQRKLETIIINPYTLEIQR